MNKEYSYSEVFYTQSFNNEENEFKTSADSKDSKFFFSNQPIQVKFTLNIFDNKI